MKKNLKRMTVLTLLSAAVALAATGKQEQSQKKGGTKDLVAMKPKNLKILPKNITHDELHKVMDNFKVSLGVKCGFCHAKNAADTTHLDFASDAKPEKETARHMMRMTMKINKKYFHDMKASNGTSIQVNCITCHHGDPHPEI